LKSPNDSGSDQIWVIVSIICGIVFVGCVALLIVICILQRKNRKLKQSKRESVEIEASKQSLMEMSTVSIGKMDRMDTVQDISAHEIKMGALLGSGAFGEVHYLHFI
jgi:hypothetical protein